MKLRRIFAAIAACAVAATMAISASADYEIKADDKLNADGDHKICLIGEEKDSPLYSSWDEVAPLKEVTFVFTLKEDIIPKLDANEAWYGGQYGTNEKVNGWHGTAFDYSAVTKNDDGTFSVTYKSDTPLFDKDKSEYAQIWIQSYADGDKGYKPEDYDFKLVSVKLVGIDAPKAADPEPTPAPGSSSDPGSSSTAPAGGTTNPGTGATAGLALATLALAGAAVVAAKKSK